MTAMTKYIRYIRYILTHKYYCALALISLGHYWQALTHDISKFSPAEFFAYADWFSDESFLAIKFNCERLKGQVDNPEYKRRKHAYDAAVLHHYHNNPHHWQYWCYVNRWCFSDVDTTASVIAIEMPDKYVIEMVCDWLAAGKALNSQQSALDWFNHNESSMLFHTATKAKVRQLLEKICNG